MRNNIHPTAYIGDNVTIGNGNTICANAIIEGDITIGDNNYFGSFTHITNNVIIKNSNKFFGQISVGSLGEMGSKGDIFNKDGIVRIGNKNVFREFITINSPVRRESTEIGNNCYFMARSHIPHDALIRNNVVMATNSIIGGGCIIESYAYIGLGSITHQWLTIGESAMIGMQAVNVKNVPPFCTVVGIPSKIVSLNSVGALRRGFPEEEVNELKKELAQIITNGSITKSSIGNMIKDFISQNKNTLIDFK